MSTRVFVLRPEPGLSATMERGRAMGLSMEAMPLSAAEPVAWDIPPGSFDGMLLGSANGLRHAGERLADLGQMPVYAVGEATAEEARWFVQRCRAHGISQAGVMIEIPAAVLTADEIMDRILSVMQAEARAVLDEGIALKASDIDVTMVHGFGFPRHRGGPMFAAGYRD